MQVENLSYAYGNTTLFSGLSFDLARGFVLQVMGRNGSGKTTLLQLLAGLKMCQEGSFCWPEGVSCAYIGHKNALKADLSPLENLALYEPSMPACSQALVGMGLEGIHHNSPCYMLSAGQQRKAALSRLLLWDAEMWLLDEPFTALDAITKELITVHLEKHAEKGGGAVVATHEPLGVKSDFLKSLVIG